MTSPLETRQGEAVRLRLPRSPELPPRHPFPLLASLAPVVGSVVIWAITSSPFALVFALLGPVIAVASFADARLQARRTSRRERHRFAAELADVREAVTREHDRERERLHLRTPGPIALLDGRERDPERWLGGLDRAVPVVLGYGTVASSVILDGADTVDGTEIAALREQAEAVDGVPVVVDARLGVGVCGPAELAVPVARGLILQLADLLPPESVSLSGPTATTSAETGWIESLPHVRPDSVGQSDVVRFAEARRGPFGSPSQDAIVAVARSQHDLPHRCRVVLQVGGTGRAAIVAHPHPELLGELAVVYLSEEQAAGAATLLARAARARQGVARELPTRVEFAALPVGEPHPSPARTRLSAAFMSSDSGPLSVDLVHDGPHAVVGGMTGSGKSELLLSWLLALAACHPPEVVNFLLVDFKGGSAFAPVIALPHVVGVVTDLDERSARRALHSLRAEVRHRERVLAGAGARSIDVLPSSVELARLVIVVDEFAALVGDFVDLHELFADLAARGRSLGIHLILCTQRPAGVVRDSVLANVTVRLSLRVNNAGDSVAVVGTDAAAALPSDPPGRAVLAIAGADPVLVQVAIVEPADITRVSGVWAGAPPVRRPWCPELPDELSIDELSIDELSIDELSIDELSGSESRTSERHGFAFGLLDLPDTQRQEPALWDPAVDGSLLVLGGGGAGKTELLCTLARVSAGHQVPPLPEEAWDAAANTVDALRRGRARPTVLLFDDLDVLVTRFGDEHREAFAQMLQEILRTGGSVGVSVVLAARRLSAGLQAVVAGCESRLILRQADRQEHLLAGGVPERYRADAPPGRGEWRGAEVQVALASRVEGEPPALAATASIVPDHDALIVVSGRPAELTRRFDHAIDLSRPTAGALQLDVAEPRVWVGDPQCWQARWQQLSLLRASVPLLIDRCTLAELRAVLAQRVLPPALDTSRETAWLVEPDGRVRRVLLPTPIA